MKNIVVAIDFSTNSLDAFRYALHIAQRIQAKIYVVHAFRHRTRAGMMLDTESRTKESLVERINIFIQSARTDALANVEVEALALSGEIKKLIKSSELTGMDFLITGAQGETLEEAVMFGKTAGNIVKESKIPVIIVPPRYNGKYPERIALIFRKLTEEAAKTLGPVQELRGDQSIAVIHNPITEDDLIETDIHSMFPEAELETMGTGSLAEAAKAYIDKNSVDLIVFIKRSRGIFEKILTSNKFTKMELDLNVPILLLPES